MKLLTTLFSLVLLLPAAVANAATLYAYKDEHVLIELTDEPCAKHIAEKYIAPDYRKYFTASRLTPLSYPMKQYAQGLEVVAGCWSIDREVAQKGLVGFVNEFGHYGYVQLNEFVDIEAQKGIRTDGRTKTF